ncbi:hypothetical protein E4U41_006072 [Claviceps citrina]|nr:hypothetical protein E4U41_006072 [Claviceps citrina]
MNNRKFKPLRIEEVRADLEQGLASLSPAQFSQEHFEVLQRQNEDAVFESDVMADVFPVICGACCIPSKHPFTELSPLTNANVMRPKPDHFDGSDLADLKVGVRNDDEIKRKIIPTKHPSVPVAATFFTEVKGPDGNASVARRRVCYNRVYGARAMNSLQNYGKPQPEYDGNAYAFGSTYHPATGTLQLHLHIATNHGKTSMMLFRGKLQPPVKVCESQLKR